MELPLPEGEPREGEAGEPAASDALLPRGVGTEEPGFFPLLPLPGEEDLYSGGPNIFEDIQFGVPGGEAAVEDAWFAEPEFDSQVLRTELLPAGLVTPHTRRGFRFGMGVQTSYDSNMFLEESGEVSDFQFTVAPSAEFRSASSGSPGLVTAHYTPFVRIYAEETHLNTIDHSAGAEVSYTGARGSILVSGDFGRFTRADHFVGGQVETESLAGGVSIDYQVAPRVLVEARLSGGYTDDSDQQGSTGIAGNSDNFTSVAQLYGFWQATERTRLGPSLRYRYASSGSATSRESLALLMAAEHDRDTRLRLNGAIGLEWASGAQSGENDEFEVTGNVGVDYIPNNRFALQAILAYDAIPQGNYQATRSGGGKRSLVGSLALRYTPNPQWTLELWASNDNFPASDQINTFIASQSYAASVSRHLNNGTIALEGSLSLADHESGGASANARDSDQSRAVALRYRRLFVGQKGAFDCSLRWSQGSGEFDWERLQAALGVDFEF